MDSSAYKGGVEEFARIHWHTLRSTKLIYNMQSMDIDQFLTGVNLIGTYVAFFPSQWL